MKKTSKNTGVSEKANTDYFHITRTTQPIESFDAQEFRKRIEIARKEKRSSGKK